MADFNPASAAVGNAGLATGIIGTTLGVLNSGGLGGILGGGFGNNACGLASTAMQLGDHYATKDDLKYSQELARKDSEIALLKSEQNTEVKIADVYSRLKGDLLALERGQNDWNASQSVVNAQMAASITTNQQSIAGLQATVGGITKTAVPSSAICNFGCGCGCGGNANI